MGACKTAMETRRSIRKYLDKPVEKHLVDEVLRLGMLAPSASNRQPWFFSVTQNPALISEMSDAILEQMAKYGSEANRQTAAAGNYAPLFHAPVLMLVCGVADSKWSDNDCGLAAENMSLACTDLGLGSCMIGFLKLVSDKGEYPALMSRFRVPDGYAVKYGFVMGYPDETPSPRPRDTDKVVYVD